MVKEKKRKEKKSLNKDLLMIKVKSIKSIDNFLLWTCLNIVITTWKEWKENEKKEKKEKTLVSMCLKVYIIMYTHVTFPSRER